MQGPQLDSDVVASAERYRTLLEINNAIVTNLNQEDLLHAISKALRRVIPFDRAAFTLYDAEERYVSFPRDRRYRAAQRTFEPGWSSVETKASRPGFSITSVPRCATIFRRNNDIQMTVGLSPRASTPIAWFL